jgi:hypothetical protein
MSHSNAGLGAWPPQIGRRGPTLDVRTGGGPQVVEWGGGFLGATPERMLRAQNGWVRGIGSSAHGKLSIKG